MIARITAETGAALKARDAALAEMAEAAAARVKEAEAAAADVAGKMLKDLNAAANSANEKVRAGMADAVAAAEASYERLTAQVEASRAVAERAIPAAGAAGAAVAEGFGRARQEMSDFLSERIRQDMATQAEFLGCRSFGELSAVQMRFLRTAVNQYGEEAARLARLGGEVMTRMAPGVRSASRPADDPRGPRAARVSP